MTARKNLEADRYLISFSNRANFSKTVLSAKCEFVSGPSEVRVTAAAAAAVAISHFACAFAACAWLQNFSFPKLIALSRYQNPTLSSVRSFVRRDPIFTSACRAAGVH